MTRTARVALALLPTMLVAGFGGALFVEPARAAHTADQADKRLTESAGQISALVTAFWA